MDESESLTGGNASNLAELQFLSVNSADLIAAKIYSTFILYIFGVSVVVDSILGLFILHLPEVTQEHITTFCFRESDGYL